MNLWLKSIYSVYFWVVHSSFLWFFNGIFMFIPLITASLGMAFKLFLTMTEFHIWLYCFKIF